MTDSRNTLIRIGLSVVLLVFGVLLLAHVVSPSEPKYWLSVLMTLVGIFSVSYSLVAGVSIAGVGAFMLLRDLGVIAVPWLGYGVSIFLIVVGIYGLLSHGRSSADDTSGRHT